MFNAMKNKVVYTLATSHFLNFKIAYSTSLTLPSETTHTEFWECRLLENSENLFKVLIYDIRRF